MSSTNLQKISPSSSSESMASSSATFATTFATTFSSRATSSSRASSSSTSNARPWFRARRRPDLSFRRFEPRRTRAASKDDDVLWCADGDEPNSVPWHRIAPRYEATEEDAVADGALLELLSPAWRILLLSDGSVTRHLRLLCPRLRQTRLECLRQGPVPSPSQVGAPAAGLGSARRLRSHRRAHGPEGGAPAHLARGLLRG